MAPHQEAGEFSLLGVLVKHPWTCALAFSPAVASVMIGCWIFCPTGAMFLALVIAAFFCLYVVESYYSGTVTANVTTAVQTKNPVGFWAMWALWTLAYLFAAAFPLLFALQGRDEDRLSTPAVEAVAKP